MLNVVSYGDERAGPALVIAHGLFGSARNWGVIARRLADERRVLAVDMRNHGQSPWTERHGYPEMADDLREVIGENGPVDVLGHSMGGKAAMVLALTHPSLVRRLVVADIAPVAYAHSQIGHVRALQSLDISDVRRRSEAAPKLAEVVEEPALQSFFLQSLDLSGERAAWRLNLDVLARDMPRIMGFPDISGRFVGPALFLTGTESDYVGREHRERIRALFPRARFAGIPGAGHWLHAEKPREFEAAIRVFLTAS